MTTEPSKKKPPQNCPNWPFKKLDVGEYRWTAYLASRLGISDCRCTLYIKEAPRYNLPRLNQAIAVVYSFLTVLVQSWSREKNRRSIVLFIEVIKTKENCKG